MTISQALKRAGGFLQEARNRQKHGESRADTACKPGAIAALIENASGGETGPVHAGRKLYEDRLRAVLGRLRTRDLETFHAHGIRPCLDQRLLGLSRDADLYAIFYRGDTGGVLSIWDNGVQPDFARAAGSAAEFVQPHLESFARLLRTSGVPSTSLFSTLSEANGISRPAWLPLEQSASLRDRPGLAEPPEKPPAQQQNAAKKRPFFQL